MKKSIYLFVFLFPLLLFTHCEDDGGDSGPDLTAEIAADKTNIQAGQEITFTNLSEGEYSLVKWTFEGGNPANSNEKESVTVQYDSIGTFKVTLIVSYKDKSSSAEINVSVSQGMPTADFSANTSEISTGQAVIFEDLSTRAESYEWIFEGGEPSTSTEKNPEVVYNDEGSFSVTLKVTNSAGEVTETKTGYIIVENSLKANFSMDAESVQKGTSVKFTDLSAGEIQTWNWTFQGAEIETSDEQNPVVKFVEKGTMEIALEVSDGEFTQSITKTIEVMPLPEENGLILYYPFSGDTLDYSGNELHAKRLPDIGGNHVEFTEDRHGETEKALYFPGKPEGETIGPAIQAPDFAYFDGGYTISLWVKWDEITTSTRFFEFGPRSNNNLMMISANQGGKNGFMWHHLVNSEIYLDDSGAEQTNQMDYTLDNIVGVWSHLVFKFSAENNGTFMLYVNGELQGQSTGALDFEGALIEDAKIGRGNWDKYGDVPFKGSMDEIRIYDHAISDDIIKILYEKYK
jgi:PKD repeat protein